MMAIIRVLPPGKSKHDQRTGNGKTAAAKRTMLAGR
jgi:hypothetical protein